jgi:hypothetical protein
MASLAVSTPIVQTFEAGKFPALAGAARPDRARAVHAFDRVVPARRRWNTRKLSAADQRTVVLGIHVEHISR